MTRWLRPGMFLAIALSATLAAAACGGTTRSGSSNSGSGSQATGKANPNAALKTGLKISFLPKQVNNPYFTVADGGGKEAVTELKGEFKETGPSEASASSQVSYINTLSQQGTDVIVTSANDPNAICGALKQARTAKAKIVTYDSDTDPSCRDVFVNQATAQGIGESLTDALLKPMGGQGKYAIVSCGQTAENLNSWIKVQKEYTATKYPQAQIVDTVYAGEDQAKATQMATDLMNAHPDLTGLVGECTSSAPGVAQAVQDANKIGKVFTVGLGTPQSMKPYLAKGSSSAAILWNVENLGYLTAWTGAQLAEGKQFAASNDVSPDLSAIKYDASSKTLLLGPPLAITKDNVDKYSY